MEYYKEHQIEDLPQEKWLDIKDYKGLYQVSNLGRVKSLAHVVPTKGNYVRKTSTRILRQKLKKNGYLEVMLSKNGDKKIFLVHRLVALSFLGEPKGERNIVNHKDEYPKNNKLENLEWVTTKENVNYGTAKERSRLNQLNHPSTSKPVIAESLVDGSKLYFPSVSEAARYRGCSVTKISSLCNGTSKIRRWKDTLYTWKYETGKPNTK